VLKYVGPSSLIVAAVIATIARQASAIELRWQAPPECPESTVIAKDVARLAGAQEGRDLIAQVTITRNPDNRWLVVIQLSGSATGHRELTADNCPQLSRAAALIIALAANPEAALDLPTEAPSTETGFPATPVDEKKLPPVSSSTVSRPTSRPQETSGASTQAPTNSLAPESRTQADEAARPLQLWTLVGLGYDKQSLPVATEFFRLGLRLRQNRLGGVVAADLTRPGKTRFAEGFGANFHTLGAQLLGSVEPFRLPFHAAVCIGPRIDVLYANGFGASKDYNAWVLRPSGVFAAQFEYDISARLSLGLSSEMLVFARRPKFVIENFEPLLYQPATLSFRVALEVAVRP
jgi:hypothetical protein